MTAERPPISLTVDGRPVDVPDDGATLLDVLRERLGVRSAKDGCSPQGQCGCCTVLVDGQPRVACVTPARRVRGRAVTTLDGLDPADRDAWGEAFCAAGASQCGFCTPGIVVRLAGLAAKGAGPDDAAAVEQALLAHLCRCTGWRTILDAWTVRTGPPAGAAAAAGGRDLASAAARAAVEGRSPQRVAPDVALGHGGFADDEAPADALVAVPDPAGGWAVGESLAEARATAGKVQGRRTTAEVRHPLTVPDGDWAATLRTTWVEPAYLELDASWCAPGGEPATPLANGGAFGGKVASIAPAAARALADDHGRTVRVVLAREDAVRLGPKRPPVAGGMASDGTGILRVVASEAVAGEVAEAVALVAPGLRVEAVAAPGPPTSADLRATGWAEGLALSAAAGVLVDDAGDRPGVLAVAPGEGSARVTVRSPDGAIRDRGRLPPPRRARRPGRGPGELWRGARRGGAALLLRRRRAHGARLGDERGPGGRRGGRGAGPHDPQLRGSPRRRHAADRRGRRPRGQRSGGQRLGRRVRRRGGGSLVGAGCAPGVAHRRVGPLKPCPRTLRPDVANVHGHGTSTAAGTVTAMTTPAKPVGPYKPIVRAGDWLVVSGQIGIVDGKLVGGGVAGELHQALANLEAHLATEGAGLDDVVKTTVFLRHMSDYAVMNKTYVAGFGDHRPARSGHRRRRAAARRAGRSGGVGLGRGMMGACSVASSW